MKLYIVSETTLYWTLDCGTDFELFMSLWRPEKAGYHLNVDKLIGEHLGPRFGTLVAGCGNPWPWRQDDRCRPKGES